MKKKILILFSLILFLSGCDVDYKLEYKNNLFKETIIINGFEDHDGIEMFPRIDFLSKNGYYFDKNTNYKYEQKIIDKGNSFYDIDLIANYNEISFENSNIFDNCFEFSDYTETDDYIYLSAYGQFYCDHSDNMKINFETDKFVIYNNADEVINGLLVWNKELLTDEGVRIQISKKENIVKEKKSIYIGSVIQIGLGFAIIAAIYYKTKEKRI